MTPPRCLLGLHRWQWHVGFMQDDGLPSVEEERCLRCGAVRNSLEERGLRPAGDSA